MLVADLQRFITLSCVRCEIDPASLFEKLFADANLNPKDHFVIITDPNSPLDLSSRAAGLRVINADPNVGGRFSALSAFGLVPAAILGVDVSVLLDDAEIAARSFTDPDSSATKIATLIFEQTEQNFSLQDRGSNVPGIGDWIEQLIAESTGKDQKGRLPIVVESEKSKVSGQALSIGFGNGASDLNVMASLGEHFILWEWVTALVGAALEIDPFNQPNVTEAKEQTAAALTEWNNVVPVLTPACTDKSVEIFGDGQSLKDAMATFIEEQEKTLWMFNAWLK